MFEPSNILINGKEYNKSDDKQISVFSPSFQYGLNIFEGIRGYFIESNIKCLAINQHLKRLINGANLIGMEVDDEFLNTTKSDLNKLIKIGNQEKDIYIKYMLCYISEGNWAKTSKPDRVCFSYPLESNVKGKNTCKNVSADFTSFRRINSNSLSPYIKCGANYINSRFGHLEVNYQRNNICYPIFLSEQDYVSESSGSSIFIVKDKTLYTPSISEDILPSINRNLLIKKIQEIKILEVCERPIKRWELLDSEGILLVGTNIEIVYVENVGRHKINTNMDKVNLLFNTFKKILNDKLR